MEGRTVQMDLGDESCVEEMRMEVEEGVRGVIGGGAGKILKNFGKNCFVGSLQQHNPQNRQ